jgi:hypothetical protein
MGGALCSALNRIGGFTAPLIKISIIPVSGSTSAAGKWVRHDRIYVCNANDGFCILQSYLRVCCVVCGCSHLDDIASYRSELANWVICTCLMSYLTDYG